MFRASARAWAVLVMAALLGTRLALPVILPQAANASPAYEDGAVLTAFQPGTSQTAISLIEQAVGAIEAGTVGGTRVLAVPPGWVSTVVSWLQTYSEVVYAEPNYLIQRSSTTATLTANVYPNNAADTSTLLPNDPSFGNQWALRNTGQTLNGVTGTSGADIKAAPAWNSATGSSSVVVGVVDSGIDYTHPDLASNVWTAAGAVAGCPAGSHGYRYINGAATCDPSDDSTQSHGTHVSGIIGASGQNGSGVTGVNWTTNLMGIKFMDSGGVGFTSDAIAAIDWAVQAKQAGVNVRVLNASWGGSPYSQSLVNEINTAGANDILFVAAAGNGTLGVNNDITPFYPCNYQAANEICVASTTQSDALDSTSNYGPSTVDLAAPGSNIYSTLIGGGYGYQSGTSMAAAFVSGAAALILSNGYQPVSALKTTILNSVDTLTGLSGKVRTGGRLNLFKAVGGESRVASALTANLNYTTMLPASTTLYDAPGAFYQCAASKRIGWRRCLTTRGAGLAVVTGYGSEVLPTSVASGSTTINLTGAAFVPALGDQVLISGTANESREVTNVSGSIITLSSALTYSHTTANTITTGYAVSTPADGGTGSGTGTVCSATATCNVAASANTNALLKTAEVAGNTTACGSVTIAAGTPGVVSGLTCSLTSGDVGRSLKVGSSYYTITGVSPSVTVTGPNTFASAVLTCPTSVGTAVTTAAAATLLSPLAPGLSATSYTAAANRRVTATHAGVGGGWLDATVTKICNRGFLAFKSPVAGAATTSAADVTVYQGFFQTTDAPMLVDAGNAGIDPKTTDGFFPTFTSISSSPNTGRVTTANPATGSTSNGDILLETEESPRPSPLNGAEVGTLDMEGDFNVGPDGSSRPCGDVDAMSLTGAWDDPFQNPSAAPRGALAEISFPGPTFTIYGYVVPSGTDAQQTGAHSDIVLSFPSSPFECTGSSLGARLRILGGADRTGFTGGQPARSAADGSMTARSSILTCTCNFDPTEDKGRDVTVAGAGPSGLALNTRIASVVSSTQAVLVGAASTSLSGAGVQLLDTATIRQNPTTTGTYYLKAAITPLTGSVTSLSASYAIDAAISKPS